ncbi:MAG: DUF951 domain-containing protein [Eubacteriales bacterium]
MNKYQVGQIIQLKKQHPCGSNQWELLRVGADFRLKCLGCEHQIMIARKNIEKSIKTVVNNDDGRSESRGNTNED